MLARGEHEYGPTGGQPADAVLGRQQRDQRRKIVPEDLCENQRAKERRQHQPPSHVLQLFRIFAACADSSWGRPSACGGLSGRLFWLRLCCSAGQAIVFRGLPNSRAGRGTVQLIRGQYTSSPPGTPVTPPRKTFRAPYFPITYSPFPTIGWPSPTGRDATPIS